MPTLVDTSVWIDHLHSGSPVLHQLLHEDVVLCHPLIIGELACGNIKQRSHVLGFLAVLPTTPTLEHDELLAFIETHKLFGQGLGWIDVHLLASTLLQQVTVWTLDQPLQHAARKLHCSFELPRRIS